LTATGFLFGSCCGFVFFVCLASIGACTITGSGTGTTLAELEEGFASFDFAADTFDVASACFPPLVTEATGITGVFVVVVSFAVFLPLVSVLVLVTSTGGDWICADSVPSLSLPLVGTVVASGGKAGFFISGLAAGLTGALALRMTGGAGGGLVIIGG
jgi:hypothetical protein